LLNNTLLNNTLLNNTLLNNTLLNNILLNNTLLNNTLLNNTLLNNTLLNNIINFYMSSFFDEIEKDFNGMEDKILGPTYPYYKNIKSPSELNMSSHGSLGTLTKDIAGLVSYVKVLVTGDSAASKTGRPLGNKFFFTTPAKCEDSSGEEHVRSLYVNNVPDGSIPFISDFMGENMKDFKGLVPGVMSDVGKINPLKMFKSFTDGPKPLCRAITLETIDVNNNKGTETAYVSDSDISSMNACSFMDKKNPITLQTCKEGFDTMDHSSIKHYDEINQLYIISISMLAFYIMFKLLKKN